VKGRGDLAAAFDSLLVEIVSAAFVAVKTGLEAVGDVEEQVDGSAGVGAGGEVFAIAIGLKAHYGSSSGKDTPINRIGEGLLERKAEAGARRCECRRLLGESHGAGKECGEKGDCDFEGLHRLAWLLAELTAGLSICSVAGTAYCGRIGHAASSGGRRSRLR